MIILIDKICDIYVRFNLDGFVFMIFETDEYAN